MGILSVLISLRVKPAMFSGYDPFRNKSLSKNPPPASTGKKGGPGIYVPANHPLQKSGQALRELQQILETAQRKEAEFERTYKQYVGQMAQQFKNLYEQARLRGEGPENYRDQLEDVTRQKNEKLTQIQERREQKQEELAKERQRELEEWTRSYQGILDTLTTVGSDAVFYSDKPQDPRLRDISKLRQFLRERGLLAAQRQQYAPKAAEIARKTEAWLQGQKEQRLDLSQEIKKVSQAIRQASRQKNASLKKASDALEAMESLRQEMAQGRRRGRQFREKQKEYTQHLQQAVLQDEMVIAQEQLQRTLEIAQEVGGRTPIAPPERGEEDPRIKKLRKEAAESLIYRAGEPGEIRVLDQDNAFYGMRLEEIPIEYLIWIANGSELINKIKQFKSKHGVKHPLPIELNQYKQARFTGGNLPRLVRTYLRSTAGKRRVEEYYHDATAEEQKVLIGAAPEFEELSRRSEVNRRAVRPLVPGERERRVKEAYKQLAEARDLQARRQRHLEAYWRVFNLEMENGLIRLKLDREDVRRIRLSGVRYQPVDELLRQARKKAMKTYEDELKRYQLDDYSVLYRRYLKSGMSPEEADDEARRSLDELTKNWRTPAPYVGDGMTKQMKEDLKAEEKEILETFMKKLVAQGGFSLSDWERAKYDPNWKPSQPAWYELKTKAAYLMAHKIAEEVSLAGSGERLEEIWQKVVRLYLGGVNEQGEMIPVPPFIQWLVNRIDEKKARLELMERNLHASGETRPTEPGEVEEHEDLEDYTPGFEDSIAEEGLLHESRTSVLETGRRPAEMRGAYEEEEPEVGPLTFREAEEDPLDKPLRYNDYLQEQSIQRNLEMEDSDIHATEEDIAEYRRTRSVAPSTPEPSLPPQVSPATEDFVERNYRRRT